MNSDEELYANLKEGTPGYRILQKPMLNEKVEFDYTLANDEPMGDLPKVLAKKSKQKKYFVNPEPNWGPKPRATGK